MKKMIRKFLLLSLLVSLSVGITGCSQDKAEEDDHHHDIPFEWSGLYEFEDGEYIIRFNENEGDESMLISFIRKDLNISDLEHHAIHVMEASAVEVEKDGEFIAESEYTYKLELNNDTAEFRFTLEEAGEYYLFMEHMPEEFDLEILDANGNVLVASEQTEYEGHDHSH